MSSASRAGAARAAALAAVLLLAGCLRFLGLGWGLRHPPHMDERVFVESVLAMIAAGDLDHRYYEYPGFVFYLLWPVLRPLAAAGAGPGAYLAARVLVAVAGVAGCALLHPLGRRLHSPAVGLGAALLLAVSLVAVETAHMFRPDVVLQALCALGLLCCARLDGSRAREAQCGAVLGLAVATKFSGVFLLPSYLAARWLAPGPRLSRLALGAGVAAAAFALASPYAILNAPEFVQGALVQVRYHYEEQVRPTVGYGTMLAGYARAWVKGLGVIGAVLSLAGLAAAAREWRRWLPALLLIAVSFAVLATSDVHHDRFLLPALGAGALLAARGAVALAGLARGPRLQALLAGVLLAAAALQPLQASAAFSLDLRRPQTRDRVLDWVTANVPDGARVLSTVPLLGLDERRLEVMALPALTAESRRQVLEADVVLSTAEDAAEALQGLSAVHTVVPETKYQGRTVITAWTVPAALRPAYVPVPFDCARVEVSASAADRDFLCDGTPSTWWRTPGPQQRGDRVVLHFDAPVNVARLELVLGTEARFAARQLRVEASPDGRAWEAAPALPGRAPVEGQAQARPRSQVLLLTSPRPLRALRLVQTGFGWRRRWGIAELRVWELPHRVE